MQDFELDSRPVSLPDADQCFPRILSLTEDESHIRMRLEITSELAWFGGHFPGQPVLPGVVQLHWAVQAAQACFGFSTVPAELKRLKFKSIVVPPRELDLAISQIGDDAVRFEFSHGETKNSEGSLLFDEVVAC